MTDDEFNDELAMLLPFYVNGSLAAADAARVDDGLRQGQGATLNGARGWCAIE
jgi:hypothetical protein